MRLPTKQNRLRAISRHLDRLDRLLAQFDHLDNRFFWLRLGVLLSGGLATFLAYLSGDVRIVLAAILLFTGLFSGVVYFHRRLDRSQLRFRISRRLFSEQLARARLDWKEIPAGKLKAEDIKAVSSPRVSANHKLHPGANEPLTETGHPFAQDLNLYGERSLHQLLDTAFSAGGSQLLLDWLTSPIPIPTQARERQAILAELLPLSSFRRRLALSGGLVSGDKESERWDGEAVLRWLGLPPSFQTKAHATSSTPPSSPDLKPFLLWLSFLALLNILFFILSTLELIPAVWIATFAVYFVSYLYKYKDLGETFDEAYDLSQELGRFRTVLLFLENYSYRPGSRLAKLAEPFWTPSHRPSRRLRSILAIASAASLKMNPFVWIALNALVPWDMYFAHRLEGFKAELRKLLPTWLSAWYELEALNSLANFGYLNPEYTFPELLDLPDPGQTAEPVFTSRALGHPLLPEPGKVCNDFVIERLGQAALITGSNMSGKSTFLRTLGINLVLANAGAPVNAASLRMIPFRPFTSIAVSDSLADGISYFYAEVRRLRALLDALESPDGPPVFYLIDEIFRGTNNRERQIGSHAYVRALAGGRGVGAISTHDLELVRLAEEMPQIVNYHFKEEVQENRLAFDYRLRPGPSPTTNALRIMEIEGLPVDL